MIFDNSVICPVFIGRENDLRLLDRLILQSQRGNSQIARAMDSSAPQLVKLFPELTVYLPELTPAPSPDPKQEKQRLKGEGWFEKTREAAFS